MYIGYDNGGWFWQKYKGGNGDYYQQTRKPAPTKDQEVKVRIDWTADHKMTFTLNGEVVFDKEDFPVSQILSETKLRSKQVLGDRSVQMSF